MGGKRGRTQRRHFKQNRENVWKHDSKRSRPEGSLPSDPSNPDQNTSWQPFATQNPGFEEYYKEQRIVPEEEWEEFISMLRKPLPAAFRINSSGQFFREIRSQLENDFMKSLETEMNNEYEGEAIRPLPWYPDKLAWHLNFSRMQLRKNQTLERFHEFLKHENEVGNITRQEAVSMVPPLFLDALPDHHILDMCAAPGSKTFQLLELIHHSVEPGSLPNGSVIANDVDVQRCNLLIHQTKRMSTANLIVTNHEAQHFPSCSFTRDHSDSPRDENVKVGKNILQFDRVLCDVPCSGDGTLRKAPDIWRKWNAGMGNGLHRLQVDIAMRGLALLKVGGKMVYSTCSMNPVENEAVVAEVLRRSGGSVELLDVSSELPELARRPGLKTWKIRDKGLWLASFENVPNYRRSVIIPSMFPSGRKGDQTHATHASVQEDTVASENGYEKIDSERIPNQTISSVEQESNSVEMETNIALDNRTGPPPETEGSDGRLALENLAVDVKVEVSSLPLERCMRIVPHDQNTGAFFISVFQKLSHFQAAPETRTSRPTNNKHKVPAKHNGNLDEEEGSQGKPSDGPEAAPNANVIEESSDMVTELGAREEIGADDNKDSDQVGATEVKEKLQTKGKWKGVDPVVFFRDEATINSIRSFYGIVESFPFEGHLVTRNTDADHVKRIYYIAKSVYDILQLNFQVGERLKITSLGLKVFERQSAKDGSAPCTFRLSSEGLPLLLPYISKQILFSTLADFRHLLQYRVIKFPDFVDAEFGEKASKLTAGCCVVVLNEGDQPTNAGKADSSSIAIVCWKGKTNLSIMVSELDAQELIERLVARFGSEKVTPRETVDNHTENKATDVEPSDEDFEDLKEAAV